MIAMPIVGIVCVVAFLVVKPFLRDRFILALFVVGLTAYVTATVMTWHPYAEDVDALAHTTGTATLIEYLGYMLAAASFFVWFSLRTESWSHRRQSALWIALACAICAVAAWIGVQTSPVSAGQLAVFYYDPAQPGLPPVAVTMQLVMSLGHAFIHFCNVAILAVLFAQCRRLREHAIVSLLLLLYLVGGLAALLFSANVMGAAVGSPLVNYDAIQTGFQIAGGALLGLLVLTLGLYHLLRRLRPLLVRLVEPDIAARGAEILQYQVYLTIFLLEQAFNMYPEEHAHRAVVREVDSRCQRRGIDGFQRMVTVQAARWITFHRLNVLDNMARSAEDGEETVLSWQQLTRAEAERQDRILAQTISPHVWNQAHFLGEMGLVIILVLAPDQLPEVPRPRVDGWHRESALLIAEVLREHGQPSVLDTPIRTRNRRLTWRRMQPGKVAGKP